MTSCECPRERDVLDAVATRRWPAGAPQELREHVAGCAICQDVAAVAVTIDADVESAWVDVHVPSSAHVWWRAQMRARQEAVAAAARPIVFVQGLAASSVVALLAAGAAAWGAALWRAVPLPSAPGVQEIRRGVGDSVGMFLSTALSRTGSGFSELAAATGLDPAVAAALALIAMAAPAAVYFAFVHDPS